MDWQEKCISALNAENMFEDSWHRIRFKELLDCYINYPFFAKGLCKCMYLFARDEEHFCSLLRALSEMTLTKAKDTKEMSLRGTLLAKELTGPDYYFYRLAVSFLDETPFDPEGNASLDSIVVSLIGRALRASEIIDEL